MSELQFDVAVVGAGPGGSAAAFYLATAGRRVVLLEKQVFPRDKPCGDGIGPDAVPLLREMGIEPLGRPEFVSVDALRIQLNGQGHRDFPYGSPGQAEGTGFGVSRSALDRLLAEHARRAGADVWEGAEANEVLHDGRRVCGVMVCRGGVAQRVAARFVVIAVGAASPLVRQLDAFRPAAAGPGYTGHALRAYFRCAQPPDAFTLYAPLDHAQPGRALPGYGWVNPLPDRRVNVGVGCYWSGGGPRTGHLRRTMGAFLATLRRDPRYADLVLDSPVIGAPLTADLQPERCAGPGFLLVGDAAGLINPFTGEGISPALQSGRLAAGVVDRALASAAPDAVVPDYAAALARLYGDAQRSGHATVTYYQYVLKVLSCSFDQDRPSFRAFRKVFHNTADAAELPARLRALLEPVAELGISAAEEYDGLLQAVTRSDAFDLPQLGRLVANLIDPGALLLRANLLALAAACGPRPVPARRSLSQSVELMRVALEFHDDIRSSAGPDTDNAAACNRYVLITGDYFMARSHLLAAEAGDAASRMTSAAMDRVWRAMLAAEMSADGALAGVDERHGTFFRLPCELGTVLAGAPAAARRSLEAFGTALGTCYHLTRAKDERLGASAASRLQSIVRQLDDEQAVPPHVRSACQCLAAAVLDRPA